MMVQLTYQTNLTDIYWSYLVGLQYHDIIDLKLNSQYNIYK